MSKHLLIIDPQVDFCIPGMPLYVDGAARDMERLSRYIKDNINDIDNITVSLDMHHAMSIFHPVWWEDINGNNPDPFTIISVDDVENGKWKACAPQYKEYSIEYVKKLAHNGKYPLCVWPEHCLIGSFGSNVTPLLFGTLNFWEKEHKKPVEYLYKGGEIDTESYSVFGPEVVTPNSKSFWKFVEDKILQSDDVIVAGEASSHCVRSSVMDLIKYAECIHSGWAERVTLLTDCMSPVASFEQAQEDFFQEAKTFGCKLEKFK